MHKFLCIDNYFDASRQLLPRPVALLPRQSVSVPVGQPQAGPRTVSRRPVASSARYRCVSALIGEINSWPAAPHPASGETSINLHKKLWPNLKLFASSSSPVCLLINMHKKLFLFCMQWVAMMYFYDNCFSMMFLSDFWLQSWMNRWFAGSEELPTQASRISMCLILILIFMHFLDIIRAMNRFLCNWFFISMRSWANRVSK